MNFKDLNQLKKCYSVTNNGNTFTTTVSTIAITCLFITDIMKGNISLNLPSGWYINDILYRKKIHGLQTRFKKSIRIQLDNLSLRYSIMKNSTQINEQS